MTEQELIQVLGRYLKEELNCIKKKYDQLSAEAEKLDYLKSAKEAMDNLTEEA